MKSRGDRAAPKAEVMAAAGHAGQAGAAPADRARDVLQRARITSAFGRREGTSTLPRVGAVVQRVVGVNLPPGTAVVDDRGHRGVLVELVFDPRNPAAYLVHFDDGTHEEVPATHLTLAGEVAPAASGPDDFEPLVELEEHEVAGGALLAGQHARAADVKHRARALKNLRPGKSLEGRDLTAEKGLAGRVKGFFSRAKHEMVVDPREALKGAGRHYSDKGAALSAHRTATRIADATLGNPALTPVESAFGAAVGGAVGTHRRAGRTPGSVAKLEEKAGHVFRALGAALQAVPIIGPAGAPATGVGVYLQEHAKGASKRQAAARAGAALVGGAVAGAIPGYGTYSGVIGLVNDCRALFSSVELHGDPQYAHALIARMHEFEALAREIQDTPMDDEERERLLAMVGHELEKARSRFDKEMRRRTKAQLGSDGEKAGLLDEDHWGTLDPDLARDEKPSDDF